MRITMEHYRDFIGSLAHVRADLNTDIKALEHAFERLRRGYSEDDPDYMVDNYGDWMEYDGLCKEFAHYSDIQRYFMESTDRWAEFADLEALKLYINVIECNYDAMTQYSNTVLSVDGGELVGITYEEWNDLERMRYGLGKKLIAWETFADFCEHGMIL